ncbi:MAG: SAM-dependent methyltransferase [Xanthomonadales bacterium]|nr:SAM-dependent methyltransferase [Xanthomonadales bacterium]NIN60159.1 SAM-dependent methyltransferase [Xanthomonadales bacterium]NIN74306.1 SAM-dependent methyltransferase [Xanthomonadales bacterium]NIO12815.1 SAM-dependent methyltransferase [Xanthomonadales bacterium]NIP12552.1 SAM-dependent methyltransferase [Xanthomonadales bacterium]
MSPAPARAILPEPPAELKRLSARLRGRIREEIEQHGNLPFSRYMERALYEPELGYYSSGLQKFGAGGDFVTAPELGRVFAHCLAVQVAEIAAELDTDTILEIGAGRGHLAADLLLALPPGRVPGRYLILERSASLRAVQRATLARRAPEFLPRVEWLQQPPEQPWQGIMLANEVVDALPVERFEWRAGEILELQVGCQQDRFHWQPAPAPAPLDTCVRARLSTRLSELPDGYRSEINLHLEPWLASLGQGLRRGVALFFDYGYPRREYYLPERRTGTLVCHYRHRGTGDPFRWPGLLDISSFVDFTALAEAGQAAGFECAGYTSQAMFLLGSGLDELLASLDDCPPAERLELATEIRNLTLPGAMGERFQALALTRDAAPSLCGFRQLDLRYRL